MKITFGAWRIDFCSNILGSAMYSAAVTSVLEIRGMGSSPRVFGPSVIRASFALRLALLPILEAPQNLLNRLQRMSRE